MIRKGICITLKDTMESGAKPDNLLDFSTYFATTGSIFACLLSS
jgi:hypothetical protein